MAISKGISRAERARRRPETDALTAGLAELRRLGGIEAVASYCEELLDRYEAARVANGLPRAEEIDWSGGVDR